MEIGLCIFATDYAIRIDELARAAEDRGYESLWVPEHTHIPTSRRSPFAGGGPLPKEYSHTLDPFIGLTAAARAILPPSGFTGIRPATSCCSIWTTADPFALSSINLAKV